MLSTTLEWFSQGRWLIEPDALRGLVRRVAQVQTSDAQASMRAVRDLQSSPPIVGDVAVIGLTGPIVYRKSWLSDAMGMSAIEEVQAQFLAAVADTSVRAIVFRVDSPGGIVDMVPEFADLIYGARGTKPIIAVADVEICSAAYWLASQADVIVATTSSQLGSIGAYRIHQDISKYLEDEGVKITMIAHGAHKVEGNPYEPLAEDVQTRWQQEVAEVGVEFEAAVARGRGVTRREVAERFGQGLVFRGRKAISLGLADRFGSFGFALSRATRLRADRGAGMTVAESFGNEDDAPGERLAQDAGVDLSAHSVIDLRNASER